MRLTAARWRSPQNTATNCAASRSRIQSLSIRTNGCLCRLPAARCWCAKAAACLRDAFDITPEYLNEDRGGADVEFDFFRYGQMGTRRFNSLKLWMAMKFMGRSGYAKVIERQIESHRIPRRAASISWRSLKTVGPGGNCGVLFQILRQRACRVSPASNRIACSRRLQQEIEKSGEAWITTTVLKGRRALRANINSFLTERRHIDDLVELLERKSATLKLNVITGTAGVSPAKDHAGLKLGVGRNGAGSALVAGGTPAVPV